MQRVSESAWQTTVIEAAHAQGWIVAHFRPARTQSGGWSTPVQADGAGFPDLVLVRAPRIIFAELKSQAGRVAPRQEWWLNALRACPGAEVKVWRPGDWDEVSAALK